MGERYQSRCSNLSFYGQVEVKNSIMQYFIKSNLTSHEKHELYLEQLTKDFVKICRIRFLYPDYTTNFVLSSNYMDKRSGNFLQDSGSLSVNKVNGLRRTASGIQLYNPMGEYDYSINRIWHRQLVSLEMGLLLPNGEEYFLPQMVGYIKNPQEDIENGYKIMTFPLVDKWAMIDGSLGGNLDGIYQVPINTNLFSAIDTIRKFDITTNNPTADKDKMIDSVPPLYTNYYNDKTITLPDGKVLPILNTPYTARIDGGSYADVWLEMNKMLAGWIGYDATGRLKTDPSQDDANDGNKPIDCILNPYKNSDFVSSNATFENENIYNDIIVEGGTTDGKTAKGRATNTNIKSNTNINIIGRKTAPRGDYKNEKLLSDQQCQDFANYELKRHTTLTKNISITTKQKFHLTEGHLCGLIMEKDSTTIEKHLILGFDLPLNQNSLMTINAINITEF